MAALLADAVQHAILILVALLLCDVTTADELLHRLGDIRHRRDDSFMCRCMSFLAFVLSWRIEL